VSFQDPRAAWDQEVGLVGFYYPGKAEPWDTLCGAGFLGNFWNLGAGALELEAPKEPGRIVAFANAEAAFQALKFWTRADEFATLSGNGAFRLKRSLAGREDFTYGGFGSNWAGMLAVLEAKFRPGSAMADALLLTGDAFLLEHNAVMGRDKIWSDNENGEGTNWLGMQLMLVRDQLSGQQLWTNYVAGLVDTSNGKPHSKEQAKQWQDAVRSSTRALKEALARPVGAPQDDVELPALEGGLPALPDVSSGGLPALPDASSAAAPAEAEQQLALPAGPRIAGLATDPDDLSSLPEMPELNLVATKLRAPLHRKFSFLGEEGTQHPVLMTFVADKRRPAPEPEPVEEVEAPVEEEVEEPVDLTSAELYALLVKDEGANMSPLDFAAMGRLRAWDTCAEGYNVQEMMSLIRWLELKLAAPAPKVAISRRLFFEFAQLTPRTRTRIAVGALVLFLIALILLSAFTGWAFEATKITAVRPDGLLTISGVDGEPRLAGVGASVQFHGLLELPGLRTEDVRRMEDVVLRHREEFHVYRVAAVTQVLGGGLRIAAEDGTLLRMRGGDVTLARPWSREEVVDPAELAEPGTGGALRVLKKRLSAA